jgi:transcription antitermination protein NusB
MINRRNIRVKALQVIYSFDLAGIIPTTNDTTKSLKTKFTQTGTLLNYLVTLTVDVAKYVETYSNQKAGKHLPTAADLVINIKMAGNDVIWQLMENKSYELSCKNTNAESLIEKDIVKKLFLDLEASDLYKKYITTDSRSYEEDKELMKYIFNELILGNDELVTNTSELFQNFDDDIEMLQIIINQTFDKPKSTQFTRLITPDKETYANLLVNTYYSKHDTVLEYITPKLKNWDADRVAKLDMIILNLGISELLYFETIPVKVTINEYIDIAKDYSTPQSGQFVNGILDSINKDLAKDDKLNKVDFRKF